ncbi:MAG: hypothetical protein K8T90_03485, partial [Planctomycetes bacterium]|nr:hypothetical protein [Planctomycetota bacterium]
MTTLLWTTVFATPWLAAVAAPAGAAVALLARRGLGRGRPRFAWGAAIARGTAVTLALVAAAAPESVTTTPRRGVVFVAASDARAVDGADRVLRWPGAAPGAAGALESLRASAPADVPASLVVVWSPDRGDAPSLDDAPALVSRGADTSVLRPAGATAKSRAAGAPRLI